MRAPREADGHSQYATFLVAGHCLAVRVSEVQEVLRAQQLEPVSLAPKVIAGLINLRGEIIPALEMRTILRLPERQYAEGQLSVVLQTGMGPVSLQVDEIGEVMEIEPESLQAPPPNIEDSVRRCLSAVCRTKERLLLVLDVARTVDVTEAYGQWERERNEKANACNTQTDC